MLYLSFSKKVGAIVFAISALTSAGVAPAQAQQSNQQTVNGHTVASNAPLAPTPRQHAPIKPKVDTFGKVTTLTADKLQLDDIPQYTGKARFASGGVFGGDRPTAEGSLTVINYVVSEPKDQVKDWYANALRMYGWDITAQTRSSISATNSKSGNSCTFQFCDQDKNHKNQSTLQIDYHKTRH